MFYFTSIRSIKHGKDKQNYYLIFLIYIHHNFAVTPLPLCNNTHSVLNWADMRD